jgi:hypothetical protein
VFQPSPTQEITKQSKDKKLIVHTSKLLIAFLLAASSQNELERLFILIKGIIRFLRKDLEAV